MLRTVDHEEMRVNWTINNWWEKLIFIVGYITVVTLVLSFVIGFIVGLAEGSQ